SPAGVLQRHLPAAERGELGAQGGVPLVQRRAMQLGHEWQTYRVPGDPLASAGPRSGQHPHPRPRSRRMTSLRLVDTDPADLATDALVIGVYSRDEGGPELAPGAEGVAAAFD